LLMGNLRKNEAKGNGAIGMDVHQKCASSLRVYD
jgi:hypothetical protein